MFKYSVIRKEDGTKTFGEDKELVITHEDITDKGQTVEIQKSYKSTGPKVKTKATVNGGKSVVVGKKATIIDTVEISKLTFRKDYILKAELHIRKNGKDGGVVETIEEAVKFNSGKKRNATQEVKFSSFDLTKYPKGTEFVVFEYLFQDVAKRDEEGKIVTDENGKPIIVREKVAEHADINDKDQTVTITEKPEKPAPTPTPTPGTTPTPTPGTTPTPKPGETPTPTPGSPWSPGNPSRVFQGTGAGTGVIVAGAVLAIAAAAYILISKKNKRG
jgi:hypothetical protein